MLMANFLRSRKSTREFKNKKLSEELIGDIEKNINLVKEQAQGNYDFRIYENGDLLYSKLEGLGGYSGVMIKSPHYIVLEFKDDTRESRIYGAYSTEKLISNLNHSGIATCWISLKDVDDDTKKQVFGQGLTNIEYLLAIGYAKPKNPFLSETFSDRIGVDEMVFKDIIGKKIDPSELEHDGLLDIFYYVRFAPSTKNLQPWRFLVEDNNIILYGKYSNWDKGIYTDLGIVMYYFEQLGKTQGIKDTWELIEDEDEEEYQGFKYKKIGKIKF